MGDLFPRCDYTESVRVSTVCAVSFLLTITSVKRSGYFDGLRPRASSALRRDKRLGRNLGAKEVREPQNPSALNPWDYCVAWGSAAAAAGSACCDAMCADWGTA